MSDRDSVCPLVGRAVVRDLDGGDGDEVGDARTAPSLHHTAHCTLRSIDTPAPSIRPHCIAPALHHTAFCIHSHLSAPSLRFAAPSLHPHTTCIVAVSKSRSTEPTLARSPKAPRTQWAEVSTFKWRASLLPSVSASPLELSGSH
jgi:hypothetical protein